MMGTWTESSPDIPSSPTDDEMVPSLALASMSFGLDTRGK